MSEFQYVYFAAVDRRLDDQAMQFMRKQSSRAEITNWTFINEYHYGDFRGDPHQMLQRGYDVHLHYANFGIRRLMFRLPNGLPGGKEFFDRCGEDCETIAWKSDQKGDGGILEINPEADAGTYSDPDVDLAAMMAALPEIRKSLSSGDQRVLYLMWLATAFSGDSIEPPVPAGLQSLTSALSELGAFYELPSDLIAAAAKESGELPKNINSQSPIDAWLKQQSESDLRELAASFLGENFASARESVLLKICKQSGQSCWPTSESNRTLGELHAAAVELRSQRQQREQKAQQAARQKYLARLAADPEQTFRKIRALIESCKSIGYEQAAELLVDLRTALNDPPSNNRVRLFAVEMKTAFPHRTALKSMFKRHGLFE